MLREGSMSTSTSKITAVVVDDHAFFRRDGPGANPTGQIDVIAKRRTGARRSR